MDTYSTYLVPGVYQYSYPTFVDTPQQICIHFLTPDGRNAFVSYPHHPNHKAAQLIPVSWFQSVIMIKLDGQPRLMEFLEALFTGWLSRGRFEFQTENSMSDEFDEYGFNSRQAA